ncbi:MAG TPA: hypothetical protein DHW22_00610 [Planctomycetaceae bacterium]|nr:hypothetical protein [Planctomycetaceae bacterium]
MKILEDETESEEIEKLEASQTPILKNPYADNYEIYINPQIDRCDKKSIKLDEEGCLSIPGLLGPVIRKEKITIEAYNLKGESFVGELDGFFARIVQHETDHLDGTLFIDRLSPAQLADLREELEEFELDFQSRREVGELPNDEAISTRLLELEKLRT